MPGDDTPSAADIRRALGHLALNQREALVMRELEGRSYPEIAELLGISESAVETLVTRFSSSREPGADVPGYRHGSTVGRREAAVGTAAVDLGPTAAHDRRSRPGQRLLP